MVPQAASTLALALASTVDEPDDDGMRFLKSIDTKQLRVDILEVVPPRSCQSRHLLVGFELTQKTAFPVAVLTLHGPMIEMIVVNDKERRKGFAIDMLEAATQWYGQPLVKSDAISPEGERLVESAIRRGLIDPGKAWPSEILDD